jgi:hypothetical protein
VASKQTRNEPGLANLQRLRKNFHTIKPFLEMDGEWTVVDADVPDGRESDGLALLHRAGAIEDVGKHSYSRDGAGGRTVNVWVWDERYKERLQEYQDGLDVLPCGHHWHVCNPPDVAGYSCRHCPPDDKPEYTRDEIEEYRP